VTEIDWTGGSLPDDYYDEFVFQSFLASDLQPGQTLYFPVVQECAKRRSPLDRDSSGGFGLSGARARLEARAKAVTIDRLRRCLCVCAAIAALLAMLDPARPAFAHASLLSTLPADGVTIPAPPKTLQLDFNEPVSPLVMRLIDPTGQITTLRNVAAVNKSVTIVAPDLPQQGTYVLSWRVISADGHPVGGVVSFAIGHPSTAVSAPAVERATAVHVAIWAAQLVLAIGLFVGVGGASFRRVARCGTAAAGSWRFCRCHGVRFGCRGGFVAAAGSRRFGEAAVGCVAAAGLGRRLRYLLGFDCRPRPCGADGWVLCPSAPQSLARENAGAAGGRCDWSCVCRQRARQHVPAAAPERPRGLHSRPCASHSGSVRCCR